jgi:hypothetical protein
MTTTSFNCHDNNAISEVALPRPYPCCGFNVPPLSFSGFYTCTVTGTPTFPDGCPAGVTPITFNLVGDGCPTLGSIFLYTASTGFFIYLYLNLRYDCPSIDGSDYQLMQIFSYGLEQSKTWSCSHIAGGDYNFNMTSNYLYDDGMGNTVASTITINQVTYV